MNSANRFGFVLFVMILMGIAATPLGHAQSAAEPAGAQDTRSRIAGVWRGHSVCADKTSPCHDEVNVYRFGLAAGRPDTFTVTASKVVDGREIVMGSGEWKYDVEKQVVESTSPPIRLNISGDKMEGALLGADGAVYRRIYLKKQG